MIYKIDLVKYILGVNRPSWSFRNTPYESPTAIQGKYSNRLLRFLCGLVAPLITKVNEYNDVSKKMYALASSDGTNISVQAYLDHYYGTGIGFGRIYVTSPKASVINLHEFDEYSLDSFDFYSKPTSGSEQDKKVDLYDYTANGTPSVITLPSIYHEASSSSTISQKLSQLKADLNTLTILGFSYKIEIEPYVQEVSSGEVFVALTNNIGINIPSTLTALTIQYAQPKTTGNNYDWKTIEYTLNTEFNKNLVVIRGQYFKLTFTGATSIKVIMG